ncbi:MAG TPA: cupin domain-containing protein [Candidatus Sphingobacterium stercoripullorum]|uniref:Cupin n=1 Tax=Candidatus Sphingobacterium stercoripullorum TaxID=2838759 RepID=A0A9D1W9E8_9SPHI|nr:cupin [Candidatus Sphingobacterium stercoripullorum]HLR50806.1 cupin domain-containing protein [Candidatus Sphingobacterium stercoripullorum]
MKASFLDNITFNEDKPKLELLYQTDHNKEVRLSFKNGQHMKKHQSPYPISVMVVQGEIDFGLPDKRHVLKQGDVISVEGKVLHDLIANQESVVRLTIHLKK